MSATRRDRAWLAGVAPALWLLVLFLVPLGIVAKLSLSEAAIAQPPYTPVLDLAAGWDGVVAFVRGLSVENYRTLLSDDLYLSSFGRSVQVAGVSTLLLLLLGYPVAYAITRAPRRMQPALLLAVVLPFLTAFLIRIYAWMNILQRDGLLNQVLLALGVVDGPPVWLSTDAAVYIGMVYSYLPFMILPLYAALERIDPALYEAAADLGCPRWKGFWLITVPLSAPGIAAGALLCFIPMAGEFVIPDLLGGSGTQMIGQLAWLEFFNNKDWPVASALAVVLLAILLLPIALQQRLQRRRMEAGR